LLAPLQDILTHSVLICKVSPELLDSLVTDMEMIQMIPALQFSSATYEHEPYRQKLLVMRHRLEQNLRIVNARLRELGEADQVRTC
jgi:phosphoenolpyruvate carboxylase